MSRTRRKLLAPFKWTGTLASAVLLAGFVLSRWYQADTSFALGDRAFIVVAGQGQLVASHLRVSTSPRFWQAYSQLSPRFGKIEPPRIALWFWLVRTPHASLQIEPAGYMTWRVWMPLWIPLVLVGLPTLLLWRLDRRRLPNHCHHCNYNLTGNTSGRCPECGHLIEPSPAPRTPKPSDPRSTV